MITIVHEHAEGWIYIIKDPAFDSFAVQKLAKGFIYFQDGQNHIADPDRIPFTISLYSCRLFREHRDPPFLYRLSFINQVYGKKKKRALYISIGMFKIILTKGYQNHGVIGLNYWRCESQLCKSPK
jgi:hypothetical protein